MKFSNNLQLVIKAAQAAGVVIVKGYGNIKKIQKKDGDLNFVTDVDKRSEKVIIDILSKETDFSILSEEIGEIKKNEEALWVIDPIDGTTNFARGLPIFCVSIALVKEKEVQLGVVFNPITNECFFAEKGRGAYLNDKRITVSNKRDLSESIIFVDSSCSKKDKEIGAQVISNLNKFCSTRIIGSMALGLCYVAKGSVEGLLDVGAEFWDYAAGIILVKEAGGKVTNWENQEFNLDKKFLFASNGVIHDKIIKNISSILPLDRS